MYLPARTCHPSSRIVNLTTPQIEKQFAVKAVQHLETYWKILQRVRGSSLRLTKLDDDIYEHLKKDFPEFDPAETIDEDKMKSKGGKERWRNFMMAYDKKVDDYNFGTLLRLNPKFEYGEKEAIFGESRDTSGRESLDPTNALLCSSPDAVLRRRNCPVTKHTLERRSDESNNCVQESQWSQRLDLRRGPGGPGEKGIEQWKEVTKSTTGHTIWLCHRGAAENAVPQGVKLTPCSADRITSVQRQPSHLAIAGALDSRQPWLASWGAPVSGVERSEIDGAEPPARGDHKADCAGMNKTEFNLSTVRVLLRRPINRSSSARGDTTGKARGVRAIRNSHVRNLFDVFSPGDGNWGAVLKTPSESLSCLDIVARPNGAGKGGTILWTNKADGSTSAFAFHDNTNGRSSPPNVTVLRPWISCY